MVKNHKPSGGGLPRLNRDPLAEWMESKRSDRFGMVSASFAASSQVHRIIESAIRTIGGLP